jgi:high-affinity nickel-transport protein
MSDVLPSTINTVVPQSKSSFFGQVSTKASHFHSRIPYIQKLPFPAIAIIVALILVNLFVWAAVGVVLVRCIEYDPTTMAS